MNKDSLKIAREKLMDANAEIARLQSIADSNAANGMAAQERIAELEEQAAINKDYIEQYQRKVKELESHISQRECYQRGFKAGREEAIRKEEID